MCFIKQNECKPTQVYSMKILYLSPYCHSRIFYPFIHTFTLPQLTTLIHCELPTEYTSFLYKLNIASTNFIVQYQTFSRSLEFISETPDYSSLGHTFLIILQ